MKRNVIVAGGGASGLMAAIAAAREGASVTVLEHTGRVGKKILSTGNGKCNLTNLYLDQTCYRSSQPDFPMKVTDLFTPEDTIRFFGEIGIVMKDKNGYIYPASEQASSVLDVLRLEALRLDIQIVCRCSIEKIRAEHGFLLDTSIAEGDEKKPSLVHKKFQADVLILATGSKASPSTGSDGSGYLLAKSMGHRIIKPLPALVQLRCREKWYKQLAGVRTEANVTLLSEGHVAAADRGELQLTDYGISGIPVFQVSRFAAISLDRGKKTEASIDFYPDLERECLLKLLAGRRQMLADRRAEDFLLGFFNKKLAGVFLRLSGIDLQTPSGRLEDRQLQSLAKAIKDFRTEITAVNPFENAQICCGGVDTREVNHENLESKLHRGLYLVGELLDVDGICGGYNLQWAWSTGALAGKDAGRIHDKN